MPDLDETLVFVVLLLPLAGAGLSFLIRRGFLRPRAFLDAPQRHAGLSLVELLAVVSVFLMSQYLVFGALSWLGIAPPESGQSAATAPAHSPAATMPQSPNQVWQEAVTVLISQLLGQLPAVALVLWVARRRPDGWRQLGVTPRHWWGDVKLGLLCLLATLPLIMCVVGLAQWIDTTLLHQSVPKYGHKMLEEISNSNSLGATGLMVFCAVVLAPMIEEILFRGLVQTALLESAGFAWRWPVIIVSAWVFAGVHWGQATAVALPGLFVLGLILGWLYESTGSLWPCILVHAGFNAVNTALAFMIQ